MNAVDLQLDYFQIYDLKPVVDLKPRPVAPRTAWLRGQFDKEAEMGVLTALIRFADRVSKNGEPLFDENAHMTGYTWVRPVTFPSLWRRVWVANQFTEKQELHIRAAVGLWVPAQKKILPNGVLSPKTTTLHHYVVYEVAWAQPINYPVIKLEDQFGRRETRALYPVAFAVPVWKKREGQTQPMPAGAPGAAHLTIYRVKSSEELSIGIATRDQFYGFGSLKLGASERLAVPSKKLHWEVG
jgi:hypothetical protein